METPDSEKPLSFGLDFIQNDLLPPNMIMMLGPKQVGIIDGDAGTSTVIPYEDIHAGFERFVGCPVKRLGDGYSVAEHTRTVMDLSVKYDLTSIHDDLLTNHFDLTLELAELELRRQIERRKDKIVTSLLNGQTEARGEPHKPFTLDDLDEMIAKADEQNHRSNKSLIEALLACGVDVKVSDDTGRPTAILPKDFQKAYEEVKREARNRDPVENIYRGMGYGFSMCGQMLS